MPLMRFDHDTEAKLVLETDPALIARVHEMTVTLLPELWPFDYGRFEFRLNPATGDINFLEVNL